jgi:DNA invertase Pin-like site-specific DNA recombinase
LQEGDTIIVWKLDRLGRSLRDLIAMLDDLRARAVKFHSLSEAIDTDTPTGRAMWQMIGVLAELERSLISERTRAGMKAAIHRGVKFGRKPKLTPQQIAHARMGTAGYGNGAKLTHFATSPGGQLLNEINISKHTKVVLISSQK